MFDFTVISTDDSCSSFDTTDVVTYKVEFIPEMGVIKTEVSYFDITDTDPDPFEGDVNKWKVTDRQDWEVRVEPHHIPF